MKEENPKVIELDSKRPHRVSQVICVSCSYSFISVAPIDLRRYDLQCPRCKEFKCAVIGLLNEEDL